MRSQCNTHAVSPDEHMRLQQRTKYQQQLQYDCLTDAKLLTSSNSCRNSSGFSKSNIPASICLYSTSEERGNVELFSYHCV